ncbi:sugar transferase [Collinsella ihumii]|nr:sugar transferase [Collinsella ihumii]MDN0055088.1 sugar transferase [Collinsella ihumii]
MRLRTKRYAYRFAKRTFDIVFSLIILVGLSWLFLVIAIAIKLDDPEGPVIFVQTRVGKDGREFRMYKFRSMVTDAEARLVQLLERNEKSGPVFKLHDDPRVTRVGRILRRVSLDELPQFVNVLKGDLSVVGPRPALPKEVAEYTARDRQRLLVKQGLTCFWQVQPDRDDIGFDEWVELDLRYIRECSVVTDLKLIGRTVGCVLTAQGR